MLQSLQFPPLNEWSSSGTSSWLITFLIMDQHIPACLVRILLIRAGIESNPGPTPKAVFHCAVCQLVINDRKSRSVKCHYCQNWIHQSKPNCSNLKYLKQWSPHYKCPACLRTINPTNPTPCSPNPGSSPSPRPPPLPSVSSTTQHNQQHKSNAIQL